MKKSRVFKTLLIFILASSLLNCIFDNGTKSYKQNISIDNHYENISFNEIEVVKQKSVTSAYDQSYSIYTLEASYNENTRYIDLHSNMVWIVPPVSRLNDIMLIGYDHGFRLSTVGYSHYLWSVNATQKVDYITREYAPCSLFCDMGNYKLMSQSTGTTGYQEIDKNNIRGVNVNGYAAPAYAMYMTSDLPNNVYYLDPVTLYPTGLISFEVTRIEYNMYVEIITNDVTHPTIGQLDNYFVFTDYTHTTSLIR